MRYFHYQGRNKHGEMIEGILEANHHTVVVTHLQRLNITPINIHETQKQVVVSDLPKWIPIGRPKDSDLSLLARQMYSLLKGGVPINRALQVVIDSNRNQVLRNALTHIVLDLESGYPLAQCFQKQGRIFPEFMTSMIEVGENTGQLDVVFDQIHYYLETEIITKKRIKSALRYPMIVLSAITIALVAINFFVVPSFKNFFDSMGATLPLATRILMGVSDFCLNYWWLLLLGFISGFGLLIFLMTKKSFRWQWDKLKLQLPLIGSILHRSIMARFTRSLAMAHQSGLPLLEAISVVSKSTDNIYMTSQISKMIIGIKSGENFAYVAKKSNIFSTLTVQMLMVSEETGKINENLLDIAQFYEEDVDYDIKRLNDLLEPILIGVIAVLVLILALGVFLPLWDLSAVAMHKIR